MMRQEIKKILSRLPDGFAKRSENIGKKFLRFFDGRDIADGMPDFNSLPYVPQMKKLPEKDSLALIYNVYYQHHDFSGFYGQLRKYESFSPEVLKHFEIIVVDDGSKIQLELPDVNLNITLLRIQKDIPWNGGGARNLGACYAASGKILFCDIDHFVPEETVRNCMETDMADNELYLLEWKSPLYIPPNIFCMTKRMFFKCHGYDEDYSGFYGDDIFFRKYLDECGTVYVRTGWEVINSGEKYFGEHNLSRSLLRARNKLKNRAAGKHSCRLLRFPWTFAAERRFIHEKERS